MTLFWCYYFGVITKTLPRSKATREKFTVVFLYFFTQYWTNINTFQATSKEISCLRSVQNWPRQINLAKPFFPINYFDFLNLGCFKMPCFTDFSKAFFEMILVKCRRYSRPFLSVQFTKKLRKGFIFSNN